MKVTKLKVDPKEENDFQNISWPENEQVVDLYIKFSEEESSTKDESNESAPTEKIENTEETLDQKHCNLALTASSCIPFEKIEVGSNDRNYYDETSFKSEIIKQEEVHIKDDEDIEDRINKKKCNENESSSDDRSVESTSITIKDEEDALDQTNIYKELGNNIVETGAIKTQTNNLNEVKAKELNYSPESFFESEIIKQENIHITDQEVVEDSLCKKIHHQCPECPYKTFNKNHLNVHAEIHEKNNLLLKCSKCTYATLRPSKLKRHQVIHNPNIQWLNCPKCSFKTAFLSVLRNHVLAHKSGAFKCSKCSYQTRTKYELAVHQVKHESTDKWHSCPLCPFKTYRRNVLKEHCQLRHRTSPNNPNKIQIFTCTKCSYENGCKRILKKHQLIHDPSKWFQCSDCTFKTPYRSNLATHKMQHQGENAEDWLRCLECSYKTVYKQSLQRHVMTHKPSDEIEWFKCSRCSFKTAYKHHLKQHQLKHKEAHEVEWFCCYECGFKTKNKWYLVRHISKHKKQVGKGDLQNNGK